ncbi:hypothetical protein WPS_27420 [Vulcanimicrobium alpinum]|uniref:Polyphosphate kinase-2-related domain-containing protein n=1 Tax=Vulcanimicrobium alpinum TaxID=3016050 RepID=A0AAN2CAT8_UNVUL|nr:hypothetical protein WPS_27420 [Vulcanimicrobium alpinum]
MHVNARKHFAIPPDERVRLAEIDPGDTGSFTAEADAHQATHDALAAIADLQYRLYAEHRHALLIVLQAMDAGGKDGTIRHVFGALSPLSAYAHAFKEPTPEEAAHDFLWRVHKVTPGHGEIAIFNRSHYEDVLVVRVHDLVPEKVWSKRYARINAFEKTLVRGNTTILKFFLHISRDEQLRRFAQRLDDPAHQWKISESDYTERAYWDDYMRAYEAVLEKTSTARAPWYVIPADRKWFRNWAVAQIVAETLRTIDPKTRAPSVDIEEIRAKYHEVERSEHGA